MLIAILLTQKPLIAMFRGESDPLARLRAGWNDLVDGLGTGARNMIGIAIATAAAGIVVGTVSITGFGLVMTDLVETISAGNVILMLCLVAVICLILGMGMPTTASYIVVSTLMAPVVVELGAQSGLVVPLVAVHMFVFYFGLMADVTPPVGLAAFAAAAISRGDYLKTGFTAFWYSIRTGILPFMFIFNAELLLIGVNSFAHLMVVICRGSRRDAGVRGGNAGMVHHPQPLVRVGRDAAGDVHPAAPGFLDGLRVSQIQRRAPAAFHGHWSTVRRGTTACASGIEGTTVEGKEMSKTVLLPLGDEGPAARRLSKAGLTTMALPSGVQIAAVNLHSPADRAGLRAGIHGHGHRDRGAATGEGMDVPAGTRHSRRRRAAAAAAARSRVIACVHGNHEHPNRSN